MIDDKGVPLSAEDIKLILRYGKGPYNESLKKVEAEVEELNQKITKIQGIKESDTGLAQPSQWNPEADKGLMGQDSTLMVGRCTKIINPGNDAQYMVNLKHYGKYVVGLGKELAPTDIEEGMRVGVQ
jgi:26S proteasome regulatory subunit T1